MDMRREQIEERMPKDINIEVVGDPDVSDGDDLGDGPEVDLEDLSDEDLLDEDELGGEIGLVGDDDLDDDPLDDDDLEVDIDEVVVVPVAAIVEADEGATDEDEDELDDDDVEASLDVILKERLVVEDDEAEDDEDEDEPTDPDERGDGTLRVLPKQPGEFVCRSCFLVKSETQLADEARLLCRDCV